MSWCLTFYSAVISHHHTFHSIGGNGKTTHQKRKLSWIRILYLETAEGGHVLGLLARDTPVVCLVNSFVVLPGRLVVNRKPLYGLGGQGLQTGEGRTLTFKGVGLRQKPWQRSWKEKSNQPNTPVLWGCGVLSVRVRQHLVQHRLNLPTGS